MTLPPQNIPLSRVWIRKDEKKVRLKNMMILQNASSLYDVQYRTQNCALFQKMVA